MKKRYLYILGLLSVFMFCILQIGIAQNIKEIDSLKQQLEILDDSSKIVILNNLCWELRNSKIQESIAFGLQSVKLAKQYNDYVNLTKASSFLGVAYRNLGNYSKAFDYYFKGLELSKEFNIKAQEGYAYINIGNLYLYQEYYNDAILNLDKAYKIAQQTENDKILGYYYLNRGRIEIKLNHYSQALDYIGDALELRKESKNFEEQAVCLKYIGDVYNEQDVYELALKYYKESIQMLKKTSDIDLLSDNYNRISNIYLKKADYKEALFYSQKSLEMAKRIGSKLRLLNANQSLMKIYKAKKDYKAVVKYQDIVIKYNDSLYNQELNEKMAYIKFIDEKYEYDKKLTVLEHEHEVEIHKQRQIRNISIFLSIIFVIFSVVLLMYFSIKRKVTANLKSKNKQIAKHKSELENSLKEIIITNEKLKELNATKDKFFTILAHDLKSPFNAIITFSGLLLKNYDKYKPEKHKELLKYINQSGENTFKLLENLLLWARSQIGIIEFKPEIENLNLVSIETVDLLFHSAKSKSIIINNEIPKDIFVKADKELYFTILRNLITNAIKFSPKESKIIIKAENIILENNLPFTKIYVIDEGIGISEKKVKRLFSVTENISTKGTNDEDGTGIGLILCKEFVEMHGGQINVESKVNIGTTMSFTIPSA